MEEAERAMVAGLSDPFQRRLILQDLQHYIPVMVRTPFQKKTEKEIEWLRARGDVVDAIGRVGRVNTYKIMNLGPIY